MAFFPGFMLVSYLILMAYFRSKGGYKPVELVHDESATEKYTGGVEAAVR
jgi:hypothetical protein